MFCSPPCVQDANVIEVVEEVGLPGTEVPDTLVPPPAAVTVATLPDKEPGCWARLKVLQYSSIFVCIVLKLVCALYRKSFVDGMLSPPLIDLCSPIMEP